MTDLIERFRAGAVAASLGALLMLAAPAAAAPDPSPVRLWSVSKVEQVQGASKVAIIHPPTLNTTAAAARDEIKAAGVDAHTVEIPDAEDGKAEDFERFRGAAMKRLRRVGVRAADESDHEASIERSGR